MKLTIDFPPLIFTDETLRHQTTGPARMLTHSCKLIMSILRANNPSYICSSS